MLALQLPSTAAEQRSIVVDSSQAFFLFGLLRLVRFLVLLGQEAH